MTIFYKTFGPAGWRDIRCGLLLAAIFGASLAGVAQVASVGKAAELPMPLSVGESALRPGEFQPVPWLAAAVVPAAVLWAVLAWVRAERSESTYPQRRAYRALGKFLRRLRRHGRAPSSAELETWCALTGKLFAVSRAAPTGRDLQANLRAVSVVPDEAAWATLWREAREALFAAQRPVPASWVERAEKAWAETRIVRTASRFPNRRQHWWPTVAALIVGCGVFGAGELRAESVSRAMVADEAWVRGDFSAAREVWSERLATHPDDWAAQQNVALSYQWEDLWGPATAHWVAAFVLNPREPRIVAGVRGVVGRMEGIDPTLQKVVAGKWHERAVAVLSPGEWQALAKISVALLAFGFGLGVLVIYRGGTILKRAALALSLAGALGLGAGSVALKGYGVLANPAAGCLARAADLRSVPSELVEQEKTAPLLAGQIVTIDGHYFGWTRIIVRSGAVGWVRRDAVLPLYAAPVARGATGFAR